MASGRAGRVPGRLAVAAPECIEVGAVRFTRGTIFVVTAVAAGVLVPAAVGAGGGAALAAGRPAGPVFRLFAGTDLPNQLATGPDGAVWFTNVGSDSIGRVTPSGGFRTFTGPGIDSPNTITVGPDRAMWFTNEGTQRLSGRGFTGSSIGRITASGKVTDYKAAGIYNPVSIVTGPDGALWFTDARGQIARGQRGAIGRITTAGVVTTYTGPDIAGPIGLAVGPDGALWFTNYTPGGSGPGTIGRISTTGAVTVFPSAKIFGPSGITSGPDGALWFTNYAGDTIGRITTSGAVTTYTSPYTLSLIQSIAPGPAGTLWFTGLAAVIGKVSGISHLNRGLNQSKRKP